ncbi:MAG: SCP2 sterol-binding domain-containing protein [Microthrixaceae bacterium]
MTPFNTYVSKEGKPSMAKFQFLTPEWVEAAHKIRDEFEGKLPPPAHTVRMNQIVTEVPFSDEDVKAYMDTSNGTTDMGLGELENPDLTVTVDYETAKAIIVDGNPQAGMNAFMQGKIKVQGDMTKLMAMQATGAADPAAEELATRIQEITE